jgi:hypothetical protein
VIKVFGGAGEMVGKDQLQIGKNRRVELQIQPSREMNFKDSEEKLHPDGDTRVELLTYSCRDRPSLELNFKGAEDNLRLDRVKSKWLIKRMSIGFPECRRHDRLNSLPIYWLVLWIIHAIKKNAVGMVDFG